MPTARFQPSFAAGVLSQGFHGRLDMQKYDSALKVGKNVFIHVGGGVSNRTGTEFIAEVMNSAVPHRLLPFVRDDNESYVMLMGDQEMKVIQDGSVLQNGGTDFLAATPYTSEMLAALDYVQSVDVVYMAHHDVFPQRMQRSSEFSWSFSDLPIDPVLAPPSGGSATPNASGSETYEYKVSPVDADLNEGFASATFSATNAQELIIDGAENVLTWNASSGAAEYNVYRSVNGVFGYIGFTDTTSFVDDNFSPNLELTPVQPSDVFGSSDDYPAAVTMAQQRLIWGNTKNQPEHVFASRIGDYENYTRSRILRADDRMKLGLTGETINRVRSMLELGGLIAFGSFGEFSIASADGSISATSPGQRRFGYSGSIGVKPIVIDDTAIFVDRTGRGVRDLRYVREQEGYGGNDLSLFAADYFEGRSIAGWAYARNPDNIMWVYLDNGALLSFAYKREHQVWAWTEHDLGGEVESVVAVPEGTRDGVYFLVKREIGGVVRRYVERLHDRDFTDTTPEECFFVDCGVTYRGPETQTMTGLGHLEGQSVVALADGNVEEGHVVAGGQITLQQAASIAHVGLPFTSEIETMPSAIDLQDVGSGRGRPTSVSEMRMQLRRTRGVEISTSRRHDFAEMIQTSIDLAREIDLFTGIYEMTNFPDWNPDGTVVVRQSYPLPMTVLALSPDLTVGR